MSFDSDFDDSVDFREAFKAKLNTEHDVVFKNVSANIKRQLPQLSVWAPNEHKVMLLCGGPSLKDHEAQIKRLHRRGWKAFTVNATHDWAKERGINPSLHAQLDARPFNERFVANPVATCRYLICSQSDGQVFENLKHNDVHIWHGAVRGSKTRDEQILNRYYAKRWAQVLGGCTIGTRAVGLAYAVGIRQLRIFGMDCCLRGSQHHAYKQDENEGAAKFLLSISRRRFRAHMWMMYQFDEWLQMMPVIPPDLKFGFEGDGALSYLVSETRRMGKLPKIEMEQ